MIIRGMLSELSKFCPRSSAAEIGTAAALVQGVQVVRVVIELVEIGSDGAYSSLCAVPNKGRSGRTSRTPRTTAYFIQDLQRRRSRSRGRISDSRIDMMRLRRAALPDQTIRPQHHYIVSRVTLKVTAPAMVRSATTAEEAASCRTCQES
jgi:hypothetical protein